MQTQTILIKTNKELGNGKRSTMKYYLFKVKMGHVGKSKYLPMIITIRAMSLDEAVIKANNHGGVKRDHKDWCLAIPREVSYDEFKKQEEITYSDPYWNANTRSNLAIFTDRLIDEPQYVEEALKTKPKIKKTRMRTPKAHDDYLNDYYDEIEETYEDEYDYV